MNIGSADTLPANFRVTNSSASSPAMQPKKLQMDGRSPSGLRVTGVRIGGGL